jgi:hypothetical protein
MHYFDIRPTAGAPMPEGKQVRFVRRAKAMTFAAIA